MCNCVSYIYTAEFELGYVCVFCREAVIWSLRFYRMLPKIIEISKVMSPKLCQRVFNETSANSTNSICQTLLKINLIFKCNFTIILPFLWAGSKSRKILVSESLESFFRKYTGPPKFQTIKYVNSALCWTYYSCARF